MSDVLVVEDVVDIRLLARILLERGGHRVRAAGSAEEALVLMAESTPEVVLLDLQLPGMDGWALLGEMRERGYLEVTRVVVCSIYLSPGEHRRAPNPDVSCCLPKPFTAAQLLDAVGVTDQQQVRAMLEDKAAQLVGELRGAGGFNAHGGEPMDSQVAAAVEHAIEAVAVLLGSSGGERPALERAETLLAAARLHLEVVMHPTGQTAPPDPDAAPSQARPGQGRLRLVRTLPPDPDESGPPGTD